MAELLNPSIVERLVLGVTDKASVKCRELVIAAEEKITLVVGKNHIVITHDEVAINGVSVALNSGGAEPGTVVDPI